MEIIPDGEYKYILHARDHFTRYSWGYPLKTKSSIEVAANLFDLFTTFGAPTILQSDNGKEFTSQVIKELVELWPGTKIINGRPRHPQSQGLVERGNRELKNKLSKWMIDSHRNDWSFALKIITHSMNTSISRPTESTPYSLVFGTEARSNESVLNLLFSNGYIDEENIPNGDITIEGNIQNSKRIFIFQN
jgi:transposase InsO family protein